MEWLKERQTMEWLKEIQTMIYKPLHRTLKIEQHEFHKNSELDFPERLSCFCSTSGTRSVTLVAYNNAPFYNK